MKRFRFRALTRFTNARRKKSACSIAILTRSPLLPLSFQPRKRRDVRVPCAAGCTSFRYDCGREGHGPISCTSRFSPGSTSCLYYTPYILNSSCILYKRILYTKAGACRQLEILINREPAKTLPGNADPVSSHWGLRFRKGLTHPSTQKQCAEKINETLLPISHVCTLKSPDATGRNLTFYTLDLRETKWS